MFRLLLLLSLCLTACQPAASDQAHPVVPGPSATLLLEGDTFELSVQACDFSGEVDPDDGPTLRATQAGSGGALVITATRERLRGSLIHRIQLVLDGGGEPLVHEAERTYGLGAWHSLRDGPEEPLLDIDGDTLRAQGRFGQPHPNEMQDLMDGQLTAVCPGTL